MSDFSFTLHVNRQCPRPRAIELADHDALPRSEQEVPSLDNDSEGRPDDAGLDVCIRITFRVLVVPILRESSREATDDVSFYVGIRVLIDCHSASRVR